MEDKCLAEEFLHCMINWERAGMIKENIFEVSRGEVALLTYLYDGHDGVSAKDVSCFFDVNTSRVAAILNNLSKKNYIERKEDSNDKRRIQIYITDTGKKYIQIKQSEVLQHVSGIIDEIGEEDIQEFIRIVGKIVTVLPDFHKEVKC